MRRTNTEEQAEPGDLIQRLATVPADRQALVAGGRELTFGELRAEVAGVAAGLTARGVGPESVVAISLPRGADLVVALLGVLTAGAAYLPVDPAIPAARREYLVTDAGAELILDDGTGQPVTDTVPRGTPAAISVPGAEFAPVRVRPDSLAYVIYTSGSTGLPKGVEVPRRCAATLLADLESAGLTGPAGKRVGWNASASFDASVQQWVRLCRGDTVVLLDDATRADPALMAALIQDAGLTDIDLTPSHADPLLAHLNLALADRAESGHPLTMLIGGEQISPSLWRRITELVDSGVLRACNVYGPTECTVDSTAGWLTSDAQPHIGSALPGLSLYLLDDKLNQVGDGEVGEIYLGGSRVARGYRRRPSLTAQRFIADVVAADGSRMYRSGDLARRGADGRLEYLGRRDGQVKVHGYRIELGEIEATITGHADVAEAAVLYRDDYPAGPGLVAYYRTLSELDTAALRAHVAAALPAYMVPSVFLPVAGFPRTVNGKLDRAALPAPTAAAAEGGVVRGRVETLIADVWSYVLGVPDIGPDDNFFKLGGHSLLAIKLVSRVRAELGVPLPVKAVYRNPRLADLAGFIESLVEQTA
ncbi:MAG TPA: non-ribosomal peptide synthetase [Pseudonocardiaceae bacterium]|nr:non-ribosomal peptide synthetase [Pseudonocardiaceae bacterium]